ncbi:MAG: hypothetical protein GY913_22480 [Proteobacteria bacterium]|nr:hypothetical protein [Pseudomonadota bacterium]MCP4919677.1 hypothetical protein [Pseudomonadota bacterium]
MFCLVLPDTPELARIPGVGDAFSPAWLWAAGPEFPHLRVLAEEQPSALLPPQWVPLKQEPIAAGHSRTAGAALRVALPNSEEAWVGLYRQGWLDRAIWIRRGRSERWTGNELFAGEAHIDRLEAVRQGLGWLLREDLHLDGHERFALPEVLMELAGPGAPARR